MHTTPTLAAPFGNQGARSSFALVLIGTREFLRCPLLLNPRCWFRVQSPSKESDRP